MNCGSIFVLLWAGRLGKLELGDIENIFSKGCKQVEEWEKHVLPSKVEVN